MKFEMFNKIFKPILLIVIVALLIAATYYFGILLPKQNKVVNLQREQDYIFSKRTECNSICSTIYEQYVKDLSGTGSTVNVPRYYYNKDKNACFYDAGYMSKDFILYSVVNCQTNEEVLSATFIKQSKISEEGYSYNEYNKRKLEFIAQE